MARTFNFGGLIPATVLPMKEGGEIDESALANYMAWIASQGPVGVALNADTGETAHLSHEERLRVIEIARDALPDHIFIVAGLAGPYEKAAVPAARDYTAAGAEALLVFPIPAYLSRPLDPEIPYRYHSAIAEVGTPLILFQLQEALAGVKYDTDTFERLLTIENVVAVKEANFDARHFMDVVRSIRRARPEVAILTGNDNFIYESFLLGADGALLGFGAMMTADQVELIELALKKSYDEAEPLAHRIQVLADQIFAPPVAKYRARIKEALVMTGVIPRAHVRPPLLGLSESEREELGRALREADLL